MNYLPWLLGIVAVFIIVRLIIYLRARDRQRSEALERAGFAMGFSFEVSADPGQLRALGDLPLFNRGHSRRARNVLSGRVGEIAVKLFEFRYTTGGGKNQHTSAQTVALFPGVAHALPDMELSPENVFHKIGQVFGYQDIDFESNPEFSRRYLVRGRDETAVRAALYPDTLGFFAQQEGWSAEVHSGAVVIYRADKRHDAETIRAFLDEALGVLRALVRG